MGCLGEAFSYAQLGEGAMESSLLSRRAMGFGIGGLETGYIYPETNDGGCEGDLRAGLVQLNILPLDGFRGFF